MLIPLDARIGGRGHRLERRQGQGEERVRPRVGEEEECAAEEPPLTF